MNLVTIDLAVQICIFSLFYTVPPVCTKHQVIRNESEQSKVGIRAFDSQLLVICSLLTYQEIRSFCPTQKRNGGGFAMLLLFIFPFNLSGPECVRDDDVS